MLKIITIVATCALLSACAESNNTSTPEPSAPEPAASAAAQSTPPQAAPPRSGPPRGGPPRMSGTITAVDGDTITVNSAEAGSVDLRLTPESRIMFRKPTTVASINSESYIGCAAVEQEDGSLVANSCHIFPEQMRGSGEGHRPMGAPATSMTNGSVTTMTNGTVEGEVGSASSVELTVAFNGEAKNIRVTPETVVTQIVPAGKDALVVGASVNGAVRQADDGSAEIVFINIVN